MKEKIDLIKMADEAEKELRDHIIPFWKNLIDKENGGFYGKVEHTLSVEKKAEKGSVLNSRILWFFSSAYLYFKDEALLDYAEHAYNFLINNLWDKECGGVYWSAQYNGEPADESKHSYCQAFALYGLSAYYKASGNEEAIDAARSLFNIIENRCSDAGGYLEAFDRKWNPKENLELSENGVEAKRTMNTLLHIFEAYAEFYEAALDIEVAVSMEKILNIFITKIYDNDKRRLTVFFDKEYGSLIDLHSYGHDIEASWLLDWGASLLKSPELVKKVSTMNSALAENVYRRSFENKYIYNECENGINDKTRVWWVQSEAVVGFINAYEKNPERIELLEAAANIWNYIFEKIVDKRTGGEWYWAADVNDNPVARETAGPWKCPYHNGRMCLEILRRTKDDTSGVLSSERKTAVAVGTKKQEIR